VDGPDANYGLRGFKGRTSPRKLQQRAISLAGHEVMIAPWVSRKSNKAREIYHSRAWTYQEYLFAKRRLVFEGEMILWECEQCRWNEEVIPDMSSKPKRYNHWGEVDFLKSNALFTEISMPDMTTLNWLVSTFNEKSFQFPHDAVSAFSGIQWVLNQAFPGGLLYGIPEFFFEAGLMWTPSGATERRQSTTRPLSESQLPSWSFLGWKGGVCFASDGEFRAHPSCPAGFMMGITQPVTTWYTMSHPASLERRQIKSGWHSYRIQGRKLAKELPELSSWCPAPPDFAYFFARNPGSGDSGSKVPGSLGRNPQGMENRKRWAGYHARPSHGRAGCSMAGYSC
jgi:hypothetical protein